MRLVLQCAMCGTHHPVGTAVCSTCLASGVTQLRLMFECQTCGALGLDPACGACATREFENDLLLAEEVIEVPYTIDGSEEPPEPLSLDDDGFDLDDAFDADGGVELIEFDEDDEIGWDKH